jgi:hypothetical protein
MLFSFFDKGHVIFMRTELTDQHNIGPMFRIHHSASPLMIHLHFLDDGNPASCVHWFGKEVH